MANKKCRTGKAGIPQADVVGDKVATEARGKEEPRSLAIAETGIRTASQFAALMSGLMSDLLEGKVTPQVGNATCNAGGKLLKVVEMQLQYGTTNSNGQRKALDLIEPV